MVDAGRNVARGGPGVFFFVNKYPLLHSLGDDIRIDFEAQWQIPLHGQGHEPFPRLSHQAFELLGKFFGRDVIKRPHKNIVRQFDRKH